MRKTKFLRIRAYTLASNNAQKGLFSRFLKTGNWASFFAQAMEKLQGFFMAMMMKNFQ
jgi:hypothetical protein